MQCLVAGKDLLVQLLVYLYGILLHELTTSLVVALRLDALNLGKQLAKEAAQLLVVVDLHEGLAIALHQFDYVVGLAVLIGPAGDELTVTHVGLLYGSTRLDAHELCHQTIHHLSVVLSLVCLGIGEQSQFHHLGVAQVVESEEVGTGLLDGRAVSLQRIGVYTGEQFARAVAQALVQVGMEVAGEGIVLFEQLALHVAVYKFFIETVAQCCHVVRLGEVTDGHRLRAVCAAYPV